LQFTLSELTLFAINMETLIFHNLSRTDSQPRIPKRNQTKQRNYNKSMLNCVEAKKAPQEPPPTLPSSLPPATGDLLDVYGCQSMGHFLVSNISLVLCPVRKCTTLRRLHLLATSSAVSPQKSGASISLPYSSNNFTVGACLHWTLRESGVRPILC